MWARTLGRDQQKEIYGDQNLFPQFLHHLGFDVMVQQYHNIILRLRAPLALLSLLLVGLNAPAQKPITAVGRQIAAAARTQISVTKEYDPAYMQLKYPGGDVPIRTGVCCDVVV